MPSRRASSVIEPAGASAVNFGSTASSLTNSNPLEAPAIDRVIRELDNDARVAIMSAALTLLKCSAVGSDSNPETVYRALLCALYQDPTVKEKMPTAIGGTSVSRDVPFVANSTAFIQRTGRFLVLEEAADKQYFQRVNVCRTAALQHMYTASTGLVTEVLNMLNPAIDDSATESKSASFTLQDYIDKLWSKPGMTSEFARRAAQNLVISGRQEFTGAEIIQAVYDATNTIVSNNHKTLKKIKADRNNRQEIVFNTLAQLFKATPQAAFIKLKVAVGDARARTLIADVQVMIRERLSLDAEAKTEPAEVEPAEVELGVGAFTTSNTAGAETSAAAGRARPRGPVARTPTLTAGGAAVLSPGAFSTVSTPHGRAAVTVEAAAAAVPQGRTRGRSFGQSPAPASISRGLSPAGGRAGVAAHPPTRAADSIQAPGPSSATPLLPPNGPYRQAPVVVVREGANSLSTEFRGNSEEGLSAEQMAGLTAARDQLVQVFGEQNRKDGLVVAMTELLQNTYRNSALPEGAELRRAIACAYLAAIYAQVRAQKRSNSIAPLVYSAMYVDRQELAIANVFVRSSNLDGIATRVYREAFLQDAAGNDLPLYVDIVTAVTTRLNADLTARASHGGRANSAGLFERLFGWGAAAPAPAAAPTVSQTPPAHQRSGQGTAAQLVSSIGRRQQSGLPPHPALPAAGTDEPVSAEPVSAAMQRRNSNAGTALDSDLKEQAEGLSFLRNIQNQVLVHFQDTANCAQLQERAAGTYGVSPSRNPELSLEQVRFVEERAILVTLLSMPAIQGYLGALARTPFALALRDAQRQQTYLQGANLHGDWIAQEQRLREVFFEGPVAPVMLAVKPAAGAASAQDVLAAQQACVTAAFTESRWCGFQPLGRQRQTDLKVAARRLLEQCGLPNAADSQVLQRAMLIALLQHEPLRGLFASFVVGDLYHFVQRNQLDLRQYIVAGSIASYAPLNASAVQTSAQHLMEVFFFAESPLKDALTELISAQADAANSMQNPLLAGGGNVGGYGAASPRQQAQAHNGHEEQEQKIGAVGGLGSSSANAPLPQSQQADAPPVDVANPDPTDNGNQPRPEQRGISRQFLVHPNNPRLNKVANGVIWAYRYHPYATGAGIVTFFFGSKMAWDAMVTALTKAYGHALAWWSSRGGDSVVVNNNNNSTTIINNSTTIIINGEGNNSTAWIPMNCENFVSPAFAGANPFTQLLAAAYCVNGDVVYEAVAPVRVTLGNSYAETQPGQQALMQYARQKSFPRNAIGSLFPSPSMSLFPWAGTDNVMVKFKDPQSVLNIDGTMAVNNGMGWTQDPHNPYQMSQVANEPNLYVSAWSDVAMVTAIANKPGTFNATVCITPLGFAEMNYLNASQINPLPAMQCGPDVQVTLTDEMYLRGSHSIDVRANIASAQSSLGEVAGYLGLAAASAVIIYGTYRWWYKDPIRQIDREIQKVTRLNKMHESEFQDFYNEIRELSFARNCDWSYPQDALETMAEELRRSIAAPSPEAIPLKETISYYLERVEYAQYLLDALAYDRQELSQLKQCKAEAVREAEQKACQPNVVQRVQGGFASIATTVWNLFSRESSVPREADNNYYHLEDGVKNA